jgi:hypothetical protein
MIPKPEKNVPIQHKMHQMVIKYINIFINVCKIFQMAIKYINIFQSGNPAPDDIFSMKNPNLGKFSRVLQWKTLVPFCQLVYFAAYWPFGIFCGHLVYFVVIWYIFGHLVYFPVLVCCA